MLTVDRFQFGNNPPVKLMNKLIVDKGDEQSLDLGELVSVVCHRGDVNHGHFVSYHVVGKQWYLNDGSRRCVPSAILCNKLLVMERLICCFKRNNVE